MLDTLAEPFSNPVGQRALLEIVVIAAACGPLGAWVVLYRQSYAAESIAHGMLPGLVLASLVGLPIGIGAAAGVLLAVLAISLAARAAPIGTDTAVAVAVTALFGAGALLALAPSVPPRLGDLLFGNPLSVSWGELAVSSAAAAAILLALGSLHRPLTLSGFDAVAAPSLGSQPARVEAALLVLVAAAVFVAVQALGNLLVVALIIGPAAAATRLTSRLPSLLGVSAALAIASGVAGLYASHYLQTAAGASIALASVAVFVLSLVGGPLRLGALLLCLATLAVGCGSGRELGAQEFVSMANDHGAGLVLGPPFEDVSGEIYALQLAAGGDGAGAGVPAAGADAGHGAGTIEVFESESEATERYARCEEAVTLICYRVANIAVIFEGLLPQERADLDSAFQALEGE